MLTWPRQNIGTYSIQINSIKLSKAITDGLNPGQVIVDTSDKPVYDFSRQLQHMYKDEYGSGKYLPVLDEERFLEIHGR